MAEAPKARFVVSAEPPVFRWPVKYQRPSVGGFEVVEFAADFRMVGDKHFFGCLGRAQTGDMTDREFVEELLVAHHDVEDAAGQPLTRDALLDMDGMPTAIVSAYVEARLEIVRKNSKAPPSAG